jgi:phosphoribosylformylglycinamidine synthase
MALTDNLNFGNPSGRRSWASWSAAFRASRRPARRWNSRSCPATCRSTTRPTGARSCRRRRIGGVGLLDDFTKSASIGFKAADEMIVLLGETKGWLGQSLYLREICGREEGAPPPVDLMAERRTAISCAA